MRTRLAAMLAHVVSGRRRRPDRAQHRQILAMLDEGVGHGAICKRFGYAPKDVDVILRLHRGRDGE
ncbi:hypothetical protein [Aureimonas psammosilenae]|uniref:hypothetical protein n=1 Tax=Aureimonas psammosilenae TaxID=2495496 RepID=UPI001260BDF0|nr:hypothetical protein [Aureimonas psammosilenae]